MKQPNFKWTNIIAILSWLIITIAFVFSLVTWQWHWFARSGALQVTIGIILTGTQFFDSARRAHEYLHKTSKVKSIISDEPTLDDLFEQFVRDFMGFWLLIAGTLIWGFGDIPNIFWPTKPW